MSFLGQGESSASFTTLSNVEVSFCDVGALAKPKPRRITGESAADGLDLLIMKTKAIGLRAGEDGLTSNENGNEWLDALRYRGEKLLWGVTKIRKYVCGEGSDAHATELINFNVLERLLYFMDDTTNPETLFEILWILTNIAAGPTRHTTCLVDKGFLLPLGNLLTHPLGSIRTQAAWALGNIVGERVGYRDLILQAGLLPYILDISNGSGLDPSSKKESLRISLWIVDNMCRYQPDWQLMKPAFDIIPTVLMTNEPAILKEVCWAIARILHQSGRNTAVDSMITPVLCGRLVEILRWDVPITSHPILRALINLASSKNIMHLRYIVNAGIITFLEEFITTRSSKQIFAVQIIGNLASHSEYASEIAARPVICTWLTAQLFDSNNRELGNEVCIAIRNLLFHKIPAVTRMLSSARVLSGIESFLETVPANTKSLLVCLESIEHFGHTLADVEGTQALCVYRQHLVESTIFNKVLNFYQQASGQVIDQMDDDVYDEIDINSDSDDGNFIESPSEASKHYDIATSLPSSASLKQKIALISRTILRDFFRRQTEMAIKESLSHADMCNGLNGMMGSKSNVNDLAELFGTLSSPSK